MNSPRKFSKKCEKFKNWKMRNREKNWCMKKSENKKIIVKIFIKIIIYLQKNLYILPKIFYKINIKLLIYIFFGLSYLIII